MLLAGLLFHDLVLTGLPKPPAAGEEIWTDGMGCGPGGIANLAVAAARYGLSTSLATVFGDDVYGAFGRDVLAVREGVDLSLSRTAPDWDTPVTVSLAYGDDRALVTHGAEPPYSQDELIGEPPDARTALVHIGAEPQEWIEKAAANGTRIFADIGWDPAEQWAPDVLRQLELCHAFVPNEGEAMAYTRTESPEAALRALAGLVPVAVITRGPEGVVGVDQTTGEHAVVEAVATDVVDATGAGDVFGAGFVAATLAGLPLVDRLRFAALGASLSTRSRTGALAAPGLAGIAHWWRAEGSIDPGLRKQYGFLADILPADAPQAHPAAPTTPRNPRTSTTR